MRRRRTSARFYIFLLAALLLVGYGVYAVLSSLFQQTAVVTSGEIGNQHSVQAVVVRNERRTDEEGVTSVFYHADEGELVYKGNKIAEIYSSGYSQTDVNKLLNVRSEIKAYQASLLETAYSDVQLDRLDAEILTYAQSIEAIIHGRADGNLMNIEKQLSLTLEKRQSHIRSKYVNDQALSSLFDTQSSYEKKIASWTKTYLADRDCIVSFYTDGYENMLSVADFENLTIAQAKSVLNGEAPEMTATEKGMTAVFREVYNDGWCLLAVSDDKNWNPVVGQNYKVEISGFEDQAFDAMVTSFTRSGGELLVRMAVGGDVRTVLNLRTASAKVGEMYVSDLRVPVKALLQQNGQIGVVLTDQGGIFVPVTVLMQDHDYAVVQPLYPGALQQGQKIKVF